jgi:ABC-type sugar transport system ATPase subunit
MGQATDAATAAPLLEVRGIVKDFPGQRALDHVSLTVRRGEIHALLGENGAGKSTLIKIVTGVYQPDAGEILVEGRPVRFGSPHDAQAAGIAVVHQHGNLVPSLSVQENLLLGEALPRRMGLLVNWSVVRARARQLLERVGLAVDPSAPVASLRPDEVAMVSIAKAIATNARLIILDEPTTALLPREVDILFGHMRRLAAEGHGFVYVSHRLSEVFDIADGATVLRDGRLVWACTDRAGLNRDRVVAAIVGKEAAVGAGEARVRPEQGGAALEVAGLTSANVRDVSFTLRAGEILGVAGLPGSGAEETLDLLYGRIAPTAGSIRVRGTTVRFASPRDAVAAGLALVPKNRLAEAALTGFSVRENVSLPSLARLISDPVLRLVRRRAERRLVVEVVERLNVKTSGIEAKIDSLSGGNQQKAILARWLGSGARVYLLNSPTAAVDVGAKAEIYRLLNEIADAGAAVLFTSTEVEEFPRLCDRVIVFCEGAVAGVLTGSEITEAEILRLAAGVRQNQKAA